MNTDENNQDDVAVDNSEGDAVKLVDNSQGETITLSKEEYKKLNETLGSLKRENKDLKKPVKTAPEQTNQQSNEPDYAKLAFLNSQKVEHPDDQKIVLAEAERLKLPLTDVLQMGHIKSQLETNGASRVAQDGMPSGTGRKGGASKDSVEYYIQHPDEVPQDLELHNKVIEAKMKRETNESKFSPEMFIG